MNDLAQVVIKGGGFRGLSVAGTAPTDFNFDREMVRAQRERAYYALQS